MHAGNAKPNYRRFSGILILSMTLSLVTINVASAPVRHEKDELNSDGQSINLDNTTSSSNATNSHIVFRSSSTAPNINLLARLEPRQTSSTRITDRNLITRVGTPGSDIKFDLPEGMKPDPSVPLLIKLLDNACQGVTEHGSDECEFDIPNSKIITLQKEEKGLATHGTLSTMIGNGEFGRVFDIRIRKWSKDPPGTVGKVVAKWFQYMEKGLAELQNLISIGEALDFGVIVNSKHRSIWVIMEKKLGDTLKELPSKSYILARDKEEDCKKYMKNARNAIVVAHGPYLKRVGAPSHGDLHQGNVLFREVTVNGQVHLRANLIDWGRIKWRLPTARKASSEEIKEFEEQLMKQLEAGYKMETAYFDFSDDNNCTPPRDDHEGDTDDDDDDDDNDEMDTDT